MKCVVFVPGILGSELVDAKNDQIWPPSVFEIIAGYKRIQDLMSDNLTPSGIIGSISFYAVYKTILDDIQTCGYTTGGSQRRFIPYPYDWRRSNENSALGLANILDSIEGMTEIILIGHSMGGLVLRYILESKDFNKREWFPLISTLITMGTPHFGAPLALAQIQGTESKLGVSGPDLARLTSDQRFPSAYQLVSNGTSAFTLPRVSPGEIPTKMDPFAAPIESSLNLSSQNIASARGFWEKLDLKSRRPEHVKYFFFGGAAHKTAVRNEWDDPNLERIERRQSGDGTVPIASAIIPDIPHGFSMKKHASIFEDRGLRTTLFRFLDAPSGVRPQAADAKTDVGGANTFGISVDKETYLIGEPIEIAVSYNLQLSNPHETFRIVHIDPETGSDLDHDSTSVDVEFQGAEIDSFSFSITPELIPGLYELRPSRELDDPEKTMFVVVESHG